MTLSLNEAQALALKATRGAGYPWGLAEEAGKAARWLASHGLDGLAALAELLTQTDGARLSDLAPNTGPEWSATGPSLCPLLTGAALSDHAALIALPLTLKSVAQPVLLAPFAAAIADNRQTTVTLTGQGGFLTTDGTRLSATGTFAQTETLTLTTGDPLAAPRAQATRADPKPTTHATLNAFAHRTYAPATEASRLKGAGAGLSDND